MSRYRMICDRADHVAGEQPDATMVHPSVIEQPPIDTGLVDQHGRRICRVPDEIGFLPRRAVR